MNADNDTDSGTDERPEADLYTDRGFGTAPTLALTETMALTLAVTLTPALRLTALALTQDYDADAAIDTQY